MATRNEATGDVLANIKGDADAYGTGYDAIDWGRPLKDTGQRINHMADVAAEVDNPLVGSSDSQPDGSIC